MRIGETRKIETGVPRPIRIPREEPRPKPDREPEPVKEPHRVPVRVGGLTSQEITYICPICGRDLKWIETEGEEVLACPKHGVVDERLLEKVC